MSSVAQLLVHAQYFMLPCGRSVLCWVSQGSPKASTPSRSPDAVTSDATLLASMPPKVSTTPDMSVAAPAGGLPWHLSVAIAVGGMAVGAGAALLAQGF